MAEMGFLYFVPGACPTWEISHLEGAGIGYAFEAGPSARGVGAGKSSPSGEAGAIFVESGSVPLGRICGAPDIQQWREIPGGVAWVGYYPDAMPTPAVLRRSKILQGAKVKIGEAGYEWVVPLARGLAQSDDRDASLEYGVALPCSVRRDADGHWVRGDVLSRWSHLWDIALAWSETIESARMQRSGEDATKKILELEFSEAHDALVACLAANYRVGPTETEILELHDDQSVFDVLNALIDFPEYVRWAQKKTSAESISSI